MEPSDHCEECRVPEHDICPLENMNCPCCRDTVARMED